MLMPAGKHPATSFLVNNNTSRNRLITAQSGGRCSEAISGATRKAGAGLRTALSVSLRRVRLIFHPYFMAMF